MGKRWGRTDGGGGGAETILRIGVDDTDSPRGMCTTYLAYKIAGALLEKTDARFADYPRLIRFNPNIPWKTRGNGAVSLTVKTADPGRVKRLVTGMVARWSDTANGANPGLAFYEGSVVPPRFAEFAGRALWRLVRRDDAKRFAARNGGGSSSNGGGRLETFWMGNGQGLVGAIGAVGYEFGGDSTVELLSYRRREMFGRLREISGDSVRRMQEGSAETFGSYDARRGRILMAPHGPDPVFYGLRGESPRAVYRASRRLRFDERLDGHMMFRSNQGTGDHLQNKIDVRRMEPYMSGTVRGAVSAGPRMHEGGHVTFSLRLDGVDVACVVYRPTGLSATAARMVPGDVVTVGGGVKGATRRYPRTVNVELIDVEDLAVLHEYANPLCGGCGRTMKSGGRGQGFACRRCGTSAPEKIRRTVGRDGIKRGLHIPAVSAHRHLTRPRQRYGRSNGDVAFDESVPWLVVL